MYLVSLYFDEETEKLIQKLIDSVARKTGNFYMKEKLIPPHLTIASIEEENEQKVIEKLDLIISEWQQGTINWVSIGSFKPHVLFITPVLNEYLNKMSVEVNLALQEIAKMETDMYIPFNWLPHTTIARTLSEEQMIIAFRVLQANFNPFSGRVTKVGLAKSRPHEDIKIWEL